MTSVKLKLNKTRALKDGNYPVVFQLIHQKRKKIIYTKYRMKEEDFIIIAGNVVSGCHTGCKISRELLRIYKQLTARVRPAVFRAGRARRNPPSPAAVRTTASYRA